VNLKDELALGRQILVNGLGVGADFPARRASGQKGGDGIGVVNVGISLSHLWRKLYLCQSKMAEAL
jgi:hypothetical protein